jgi:hypothetical protein
MRRHTGTRSSPGDREIIAVLGEVDIVATGCFGNGVGWVEGEGFRSVARVLAVVVILVSPRSKLAHCFCYGGWVGRGWGVSFTCAWGVGDGSESRIREVHAHALSGGVEELLRLRFRFHSGG